MLSGLRFAEALLAKLTERLPPGTGQRHGLSVDSEGKLCLSLMLPSGWVGTRFTLAEYEQSVDDLVAETEEALRVLSSNRCDPP